MSVCVIPARGGSRRISRKNIREFHGRPIIEYSIETARASQLFSRVIVSTDDTEIASIAKAAGADIHTRSEKDAHDDVGTQEVAKRVFEDEGIEEGVGCVLYATAPMVLTEDLTRAIKLLVLHNAEYVVSVGAAPLRDAGAFYVGWVTSFVRGHPLYNQTTVVYPLSENRVCDINYDEDWMRAEHLYFMMNQRGG